MAILKQSVTSFELQQMTPMVHFQGEEDGAGIRASDLKPRFDAFLQRYVYDEIKNYTLSQEKSDNTDKISASKLAFDYKVKIINSDKKKISFYKGKNKKDKNKKSKNTFYGSFYGELEDGKSSFYNEIKVIMISPHPKLREKIKECFPIFLAVNGFGLRNNKGYGYFKQKNDNEDAIIENIKKYQSKENEYIKKEGRENKEKGIGIYQFTFLEKEKVKEKKIHDILDKVKIFHQIVKSGLNHNKYIPSLMLKEAKVEKGVTREKKALKLFLKKMEYDISALTKKGESDSHKDNFDNLDKEKIYYVRGLLGLAPFYEFNKVGATFNIEIKDKENFRFASPIKYLPISYNRVIVLVDYSQIEDFREEVKKERKKASKVTFSLEKSKIFKVKKGKNLNFLQKSKKFSLRKRKEVSLKKRKRFNAKIPSEEQYSVHQLFKKDGIIMNNISKGKFNYSVISDIEL